MLITSGILGFDQATVEVEFEYKNCCYDEEGLVPLGSSKLEKSSCSERTCFYSKSLPHSTWISKQVLGGCGCCEVEGKLVKDGYMWAVGDETLGIEKFIFSQSFANMFTF